MLGDNAFIVLYENHSTHGIRECASPILYTLDDAIKEAQALRAESGSNKCIEVYEINFVGLHGWRTKCQKPS